MSEKCEKIPIEKISLQKKYIYSNVSPTVYRGRFAGVPRVFLKYTDTNFLPKLRKCCHEVMVGNCYKRRAVFRPRF